jgi:PKD repeat protein
VRKEKLNGKTFSILRFLFLTILTLSLITGLSSAPPSTRLAVTVQTDTTPPQVWNELYVEGENITTPGFAPLQHAVHLINYVKANEVVLVPDVDWNVTECRLYIIHDAVATDIITVSYLGGYALRETVEISGTMTFDGNPVDKGWMGIQVESTGANIALRTIPTGTVPMFLSDVEVTSFFLTDTLSNPKNTFKRGETVGFYITVKNKGVIVKDVLIAFNLLDSDNAIHGFKSAAIHNLLPGSVNTLYQEVTIEKWASVGNTQAHAVVFSDWPKNNGYPYAPETSTNLTIIESDYLIPPTNPIPPQPVENGTYQMRFRLPPDPNPGTYTVSVCARYDALYSEARSATFRVLDITAPPRAAFIAQPPITGPNATVQFDGSFSSAEGFNDSVTSWQWDFGDSGNATGKTPSHAYTQNGNYTVTLNVTDTEGYWNTTSKIVRVTELHDVALTSIQCPTQIYSDWMLSITIKVRNQGTYAETFNITAYFNSSTIGTTTVSNLEPQLERTVYIQWNTTGLPIYVSYTVTAEAPLPTDVNLLDNTITYGTTSTKALGDTDGDRDIDIFDIVLIASVYGEQSGQPRWNLQADLQPNGTIDIFDVVIAASNYGAEY